VPNSRPGIVTSSRPVRTRRSLSEPTSARSDPSPIGFAAGVRRVQTIRPTPITAIVQKTSSKPTRSAVTPITGPSSAPAIAAPIAEPISWPRFSFGAAAASQAIAPAQDAAPPTPWTKRATSSTTMLLANANTTLASTISARPAKTVGRTPTRAAMKPPGRPPTKVPIG
jgi:hypothetical protein